MGLLVRILAVSLLVWSCATPYPRPQVPDTATLEFYELGQLRWSQTLTSESPLLREVKAWLDDHPRGWTRETGTYLPAMYLKWEGGAMNFLPARNLVLLNVEGADGRRIQLGHPIKREIGLLWLTLLQNEQP